MFRHQGKNRTFKHNLQIASILSLVAGMVNVVGFLAIQQLTTNVTGHFALFINDVANAEFWKGTVYFFYILSFFLGALSSSLLIEGIRLHKRLNIFLLPVLLEALILLTVVIMVRIFPLSHFPDLIACLLLFAMGLQNSTVTKISNAVVRTTHLTGLFTDLGIEIAHLFFPRSFPFRDKLKATIKLRIYIISFFFAGGLVGGFFYSELEWRLNSLLFGVLVLLISLFYDDFRYRIIKAKRKIKRGKHFKKHAVHSSR